VIKDSIVELKKNYRFGLESGIRAVSLAVNQGDGNLALRILKSGEYDDIRWKTLPEPNALYSVLRENVLNGFKPCLETKDPFEAHLEKGLTVYRPRTCLWNRFCGTKS